MSRRIIPLEQKQKMALRPQSGPQEQFLASKADIVIYGGSAGGGKTFGTLLEGLRHVNVPGFGAVIFRRESTQITNEGGLWDEAMKIYPYCGAMPKVSPPMGFTFPSGAKIGFNHLNQESDVLNWQGAQIPLIMFDELTHFTRMQFFYMLSRNRSTCGVRPYIRATCNPDADSWVKEFIAWWIDADTGLPIKERSGVLRYFTRVNDVVVWGDDPKVMAEEHGVGVEDMKSVTFISASIYDNPILLKKDPGYLANLKALARVERERLLQGNWNAKPASGAYFSRHDAKVIPRLPHHTEIAAVCRGWDFAATEPSEQSPDPDWTVGVKMIRKTDGRYMVVDMARFREKSKEVRSRLKRTTENDNSRAAIDLFGNQASVRIPQDPGQAGKDQSSSLVSMLSGYAVRVERPTGDKITRALPFSAAWQNGDIDVLAGPWNEAFFQELESFYDPSCHDDIVDAAADAFNELSLGAISAEIGVVGAMESANADWN